jgi:hypothetical protein
MVQQNVLTYGLIAKRAVEVLENNLVFANQVYRGYEEEYSKNLNGYRPGSVITVRRPTEFTYRRGPVASVQDVQEGSVQINVNMQGGADMNFTSKDMTLDITEFSERFIEPAMITIAQGVDQDVSQLVGNIPNWVGTPGNVLSNFNSFAAATQRLDDTSIGTSPRTGIVSPADARGLQANLTGPTSIFATDLVKDVYQNGKLPPIDGVELFKTQNYYTQTCGTRTNGTLNGGTLTQTWAATKDTNQQSFTMTGLGNGGTVNAGEVFTLAGVYDVNPRNKVALPYLKQFVVAGNPGQVFTADSGGALVVTASPPVITNSAWQNASAGPATNAVVTWVGTASTSYINNVVFNKNAFAMVMVPLERPQGGNATVSRMSHKGINVRLCSFWDGKNDNNIWRFDVLYGLQTIDPRQAVRLSGT